MKEQKVFIVLIFLLLVIAPSSIAYRVEALNPIVLRGTIFDANNLLPIGNATIQVWDTTLTSPLAWKLVKVEKTDLNGHYSINFNRSFPCRVYVFHTNSSSSGFDYVPAFRDIYLSGDENLTFALRPGGSLVIDGDLRFVESTKPADTYTFTVIDPKTGYRLGNGSVSEYGEGPHVHDFLRLGSRYAVVPADTPFDILVNASVQVNTGTVYRIFRLGGENPFVLRKGDEVRVDVGVPLFLFSLGVVEDHVKFAENSLNEVEQRGFFVTLEQQDLTKAKELVRTADLQRAKGSYDEGYADLREAYLGTLDIGQRIDDMYVNASSSVAILTFFLVLTVVALASMIFDRLYLRVLGVCGFASLFFTILYLVYPGIRLVPTYTLFIDVGVGLGVAFSIYFILSRFADERLLSVFSIGRENLKRRRLRFVLTLISVIVLAMSFVTFTSFSTGYGLTIRSFGANNLASEGVLIRRSLPSDLSPTVTFVPLDSSTITWIQGKQLVTSVAPKFENMPMFDSVGILSSPTRGPKNLQLLGVLGIHPSTEAEFTRLNESVIQGKYLDDHETNGVLLSRIAAEKLGVSVGDELLLTTDVRSINVSLVGVLDDSRFASIKDVDAQPLVPKKLIMTILSSNDPPIIEVTSCDPSEVIVMNWQTSQMVFGAVSLSRVDIKLSDSGSATTFSRQIALERDLSVWSSFGGNVNQMSLGEYTEAKGLSVLIPWVIVVLNVIITMLNSMFERRKEISILSSIGLNPSHIGGIFMAEAAIIGVVGGGVGYILGLGGYQGMLALSVAVEVRQKVSALWSLASLGVAVTAVLVGTGLALRSSVIITPSLLRKWTGEKRIEEKGGQYEFQMPVRLHEESVADLFIHLKKIISDHLLFAYPNLNPDYVTKRTNETEMEDTEVKMKTIDFNYFFGQNDFVGSSPFSLIAVKKNGEETYALKLICKSTYDVEKKVTYIRMLIVDWDAQRK